MRNILNGRMSGGIERRHAVEVLVNNHGCRTG